MTVKQRQSLVGLVLLFTLMLAGFSHFETKPKFEIANAVNRQDIDSSKVKTESFIFSNQVMETHREIELKRTFYSANKDIFEAYVPQKKVTLPMVQSTLPARKIIKQQPAVQLVQPVEASTPPTPLQPPPVPFSYLGKLLSDDEYVVFLGLHGRSLSVKMGDTIQELYKIEEIKPPIMQMTYLPLNIKQTIAVGEQ